jgi:Na+/H+-dicarboxylate symporter
LCGTVISGIPSGGMLGELLIISIFGFPIEAMPVITVIGTIVDPPATMVNVVGDSTSSMMVARILNGPRWMENSRAAG